MKSLFVLSALYLCFFRAAAQILPILCSVTSTVAVPAVTVPCVTYTYSTSTSTIPITVPAETTVVTTTITSYTPTDISCLSSATTLPPRQQIIPRRDRALKNVDVEPRQLLPSPSLSLPALPALLCPVIPTGISVIAPVAPDLPCVAVTTPVQVITSTITVGVTVPSVVPVQPPRSTLTATRREVLPTPAAYAGLKYYQYGNNGYFYNGQNAAGYGGGGYTTADWANNTGFEFTGTTSSVSFETPDWPNGPSDLQLPGMPAPRASDFWTVLFQGFLHAREAGSWTIAYSPPVDNAGYTWVGETAYRTFADGNNALDVTEFATNPPESNTFEFAAGEFVPVTVIVANGGGPMRHYLRAISPSGTEFQGFGPDLFVPGCEGGEFIP